MSFIFKKMEFLSPSSQRSWVLTPQSQFCIPRNSTKREGLRIHRQKASLGLSPGHVEREQGFPEFFLPTFWAALLQLRDARSRDKMRKPLGNTDWGRLGWRPHRQSLPQQHVGMMRVYLAPSPPIAHPGTQCRDSYSPLSGPRLPRLPWRRRTSRSRASPSA